MPFRNPARSVHFGAYQPLLLFEQPLFLLKNFLGSSAGELLLANFLGKIFGLASINSRPVSNQSERGWPFGQRYIIEPAMLSVELARRSVFTEVTCESLGVRHSQKAGGKTLGSLGHDRQKSVMQSPHKSFSSKKTFPKSNHKEFREQWSPNDSHRRLVASHRFYCAARYQADYVNIGAHSSFTTHHSLRLDPTRHPSSALCGGQIVRVLVLHDRCYIAEGLSADYRAPLLVGSRW